MTRTEAVFGGLLLAFAAAIALEAAKLKGRAPVPAPRASQGAGADSVFNVPLERTAAERMRRAAARATLVNLRIADEQGATFIDDVLLQNDSVVRRWVATPNAPVRVWIQVPSSQADFHPGYVDLVLRAFDTWSGIDGLRVRFVRVDDSVSAAVRVVWTSRFADNRIGLTRIEAINDTIRMSRITIATQRSEGAALLEHDIARCALHEVGHLLGLAHTADATSIMAAESAQPMLSPRDRATARLLYALPVGSIRSGATR